MVWAPSLTSTSIACTPVVVHALQGGQHAQKARWQLVRQTRWWQLSDNGSGGGSSDGSGDFVGRCGGCGGGGGGKVGASVGDVMLSDG